MKKPMLGLLVGAFLGIFDGLSALVSAPNDPEVRAGILGIVMMGVLKGIVAGLVIGAVSRRFGSLWLGALVGLGVGLLLALPIALIQGQYYFAIMLPGGIVGLLIGIIVHRAGPETGGPLATASSPEA